MKIKTLGFVMLFILSANLQSQYISKVLEYVPAPGQLINASPWGIPSAAHTIIGGNTGTLSLGAFGGYVVFAFDEPVENDHYNPFGIDFTIFGNALSLLSEPGIVMVMKDENNNGLADDTWYELAGSDYYFASTTKNYGVTYFNPGDTVALDVLWHDNQSNTGFIFANSYHSQSYYPLADSFPMINEVSFSFAGTRLGNHIDTSNTGIITSKARAFGYADNHVRGSGPHSLPDNPYTHEIENSGGDAFDIGWAVNEEGLYVALNQIDFVKVYTAVLGNAGWIGEISTEITGAVDVHPDPSTSGVLSMIVISDLPDVIKADHYQLETMVFYKGIPQYGEIIHWGTNMPEAWVDENNLLTVTKSGQLEITASLANNPAITTTVATTIELPSFAKPHSGQNPGLNLFPNPVYDGFKIRGIREANVIIFNANGQKIYHNNQYHESEVVHVETLQPGLYVVVILVEGNIFSHKFIKK